MELDHIEKYFRDLEELGIADSTHVSFFLTADRKYFDNKKSRDNAVIKDMLSKLISGKYKVDMASLPVARDKKAKSLNIEDEKRLNVFMDELTEYVSTTREGHKKYCVS